MRYVTANNRRIPLGAYVRGIKLAIENPDAEFKEGLTCWCPCTGAEIRQQFRESIHDRINARIPYVERGVRT